MADGGGGRQTSCSYDFKEPSARRAKGRAGDIRFKTSFRNTIYDAFKRRGWKETSSELDWDIHWCERDWMHETFDHVHLEHWQRVNHFRNDRELCRKDLLVKNLKRQRKQLEKEKRTREAVLYDFWPTTYVLPGDYALFAEEFKRKSGGAWIMKPIGKCQGRGIFLFSKLSQISQWKSTAGSRTTRMQRPTSCSGTSRTPIWWRGRSSICASTRS